jgi:phage terminase small subunit
VASRALDEHGLSVQERRFADAYLADPERNSTAAYRFVYPKASQKSAIACASRMLTGANVQAYISHRQRVLFEAASVDQERIIKELARCAFFDVRTLFENGRLKPVHELDEDTARAIASIEIQVAR